MIAFALLLVAQSTPVLSAGQALELPIVVRVLPGVKPTFRALDLVDALDRALRSTTILRAREVIPRPSAECRSETRCLLEAAALNAPAELGIVVFVGRDSTELLLLDIVRLRGVLGTVAIEEELLAETMTGATWALGARGTFRELDALVADARQFLDGPAKSTLVRAGLWGATAQVRISFGGSAAERLHVNGSTLAIGEGASVLELTDLRAGTLHLAASNGWSRMDTTLELTPGSEAEARFELPPPPGRATKRWLFGGGLGAGLVGAGIVVGASIAAVSAPRPYCIEPTGGPVRGVPCHAFRVLIPVGGGLLGAGAGALGAAFFRDEVEGLGLVDVLAVGVAAGIGVAVGAAVEGSR